MKYLNPVRIRSVDKNQPVKYAKFDDFGSQCCNFWKTSACVIWLVHDSDLVCVTHNTCSIYDIFLCQNFEKNMYIKAFLANRGKFVQQLHHSKFIIIFISVENSSLSCNMKFICILALRIKQLQLVPFGWRIADVLFIVDK